LPIILGPNSLESIGPGYPHDPNAAWPASWLEKYEFIELPPPDAIGDKEWEGQIAEVENLKREKRKWEKVGCFDHGVDWFGDGSLWLIDTPGVSPLLFSTRQMSTSTGTDDTAYDWPLDAFCQSHGGSPNLCVRLSPHVPLRSADKQMYYSEGTPLILKTYTSPSRLKSKTSDNLCL
jgi:hypothetical protein